MERSLDSFMQQHISKYGIKKDGFILSRGRSRDPELTANSQ
jgi:hypothetical protein